MDGVRRSLTITVRWKTWVRSILPRSWLEPVSILPTVLLGQVPQSSGTSHWDMDPLLVLVLEVHGGSVCPMADLQQIS